MSSFSGWVNLVTFLGRRPLAPKLSRMPPMCSAFQWHTLQPIKMTRWLTMDRVGVKLLHCVWWEKSLFFRPFFIIHISQKKHCNYVSLCLFTRCHFPGQITKCMDHITRKATQTQLHPSNAYKIVSPSWGHESPSFTLRKNKTRLHLMTHLDLRILFSCIWCCVTRLTVPLVSRYRSWNIRNGLPNVMSHKNRIWSYALQEPENLQSLDLASFCTRVQNAHCVTVHFRDSCPYIVDTAKPPFLLTY